MATGAQPPMQRNYCLARGTPCIPSPLSRSLLHNIPTPCIPSSLSLALHNTQNNTTVNGVRRKRGGGGWKNTFERRGRREGYFQEEGGKLSRGGRDTFKRRKGYFQVEEGKPSRGGRNAFKSRRALPPTHPTHTPHSAPPRPSAPYLFSSGPRSGTKYCAGGSA